MKMTSKTLLDCWAAYLPILMTNAAAVGAVAKQLLPPRHCCTDPIKEDVVSLYYLYYHKVEKEKLTARMQKKRIEKRNFQKVLLEAIVLGSWFQREKIWAKFWGRSTISLLLFVQKLLGHELICLMLICYSLSMWCVFAAGGTFSAKGKMFPSFWYNCILECSENASNI